MDSGADYSTGNKIILWLSPTHVLPDSNPTSRITTHVIAATMSQRACLGFESAQSLFLSAGLGGCVLGIVRLDYDQPTSGPPPMVTVRARKGNPPRQHRLTAHRNCNRRRYTRCSRQTQYAMSSSLVGFYTSIEKKRNHDQRSWKMAIFGLWESFTALSPMRNAKSRVYVSSIEANILCRRDSKSMYRYRGGW